MVRTDWVCRCILFFAFVSGLVFNCMAGIAGLVRQSTYDKLYREYVQLQNKYWQVTSEKNRLDVSVERLNSDVAERDLANEHLRKTKEGLERLRKYQVVVWTEGVLLVGLMLVILLGKRKQQPSAPMQDDDRCPKCGFKKTKGDSHCRNCNLRF